MALINSTPDDLLPGRILALITGWRSGHAEIPITGAVVWRLDSRNLAVFRQFGLVPTKAAETLDPLAIEAEKHHKYADYSLFIERPQASEVLESAAKPR